MAVTETRNNGWQEPQKPGGPSRPPVEPGEHPTGWSEAQAIGGELESWLEAFTGPRRSPQEIRDLIDALPDETQSESTRNNWREPLDEVGGDTLA